jgi:hypothetical protein
MNSTHFSLRNRLQLAVLRLLATILGLVDGLFNVQWGERVLDRLADHWQAQIDELDESLARLETERQKIQQQAETLALHAAAIYLAGRSLTHDELCFDPSDSRDEEMLDTVIDLLVKNRLAAIETEEVEPDRYVYHLEPDWVMIRARLSDAANQAEPMIAEWFREGLRLIDEAFLPQAES